MKMQEMMERRWLHVQTEYSKKHERPTEIVITQASLDGCKSVSIDIFVLI